MILNTGAGRGAGRRQRTWPERQGSEEEGTMKAHICHSFVDTALAVLLFGGHFHFFKWDELLFQFLDALASLDFTLVGRRVVVSNLK